MTNELTDTEKALIGLGVGGAAALGIWYYFTYLLPPTTDKANLTIYAMHSQQNTTMAGVKVSISGVSPTTHSDSGYTNNIGRMTFYDLPVGTTYDIKIEMDGYETITDTVTVASPVTRRDYYLERNTTNVVMYVYADNYQSSVHGALVSLIGETEISGYTDLGVIRFSNVPIGTYDIRVSKEGYQDFTTTVTLLNITETMLKFTMEPPPTQYGTVTITAWDIINNIPIPYVTIKPCNMHGPECFTSTTDAEGKCTFANMPYGEYDLLVLHDNYYLEIGQLHTYYALDKETDAVLLRMIPKGGQPVGYVLIHTVDQNGTPIINATVKATHQQSGVWWMQWTQPPNGQTIFNNIPFGSYTITASMIGYETTTVTIPSLLNIPIEVTITMPIILT